MKKNNQPKSPPRTNTSSLSEKCKCPYCDEELKLSCFEPPFCEPCSIEFVICEKCGQPVKKEDIKNHKCR